MSTLRECSLGPFFCGGWPGQLISKYKKASYNDMKSKGKKVSTSFGKKEELVVIASVV